MGRFAPCPVPNDDPERLERVLNAKKRLIGIDVQALGAQVEEHARQRDAQLAEESARLRLSQEVAATLDASAARAAEARAGWNRELAAFRAGAQGRAAAREWDLSRPDAKRLDSPARVGDDDPRCGPASMQRFDGEDLAAGARTEAQMQQARAWWDAQRAEHQAAAAAAAAEAAERARLVAHQDDSQRGAAAQEAAACRRAAADAAAENARLAAARAEAAARAAADEAARTAGELRATEGSAWLREDPALAASALSPARVRRDHWKGMTPEQRAAIRAEQLAQSEAARDAAALAEAEESAAAAASRGVSLALTQQALAAALARRRAAEAVAGALRQQVAEKAARDATAKEVLGTNRVDASYFSQFGTSHR
ncbi:hypothetical protein Rsub_11407 [Raphidocelis subcapitata]|uniref:Uncharacterized protein n=1 Tax=Raphidocelis subcapitata TaxID=307507 RepID=A0A2V0PKZ1_9CHLO|nr:hypothetical protein Rsub_11407 [Raphidocelis subcapitata]|eukprot:GBF98693.1 hypothetical protein Rsub_11407 [Raphidocelis subcapitata]